MGRNLGFENFMWSFSVAFALHIVFSMILDRRPMLLSVAVIAGVIAAFYGFDMAMERRHNKGGVR